MIRGFWARRGSIPLEFLEPWRKDAMSEMNCFPHQDKMPKTAHWLSGINVDAVLLFLLLLSFARILGSGLAHLVGHSHYVTTLRKKIPNQYIPYLDLICHRSDLTKSKEAFELLFFSWWNGFTVRGLRGLWRSSAIYHHRALWPQRPGGLSSAKYFEFLYFEMNFK